jgi:predicted transcriptional regulator of viral defense system
MSKTAKKQKTLRKGLSEKELDLISNLELKNKYFFTTQDIKPFFKNDNERKVYIHRLKNKGRVVKLNQSKYFLIPIKAVKGNWSEHPFILIDEIMNGKNYCITGGAAANYWKLIDQVPLVYGVWNTKKHKRMEVFNAILDFKKHKKKDIPKSTEREIYDHKFLIATKEESRKWQTGA